MRIRLGLALVAATGTLSATAQTQFFATQTQFFAAIHAREILVRDPTEGELATLGGEAREAAVVRKLVQATETQALQAPIVRLYLSCLGRFPDYEGFEYYTRLLASGGQWLDSIADEMAGSPEFMARYGAVDNRAFVELLYKNVLRRLPEPAGVRYWAAQLDAGQSRAWVLLRFSEDPENIFSRAREVDEFIAAARLLHGEPAMIDPGADLEDYIAGVLSSRRYVVHASPGR